jgi:4-amino-4-deoxy-L-arabinose transferase-like glycosyltransferase
LYLVAGAFRLLGDSMHAIRAVAVLFGLLTVVAAYSCGREVGERTAGGASMGLVLAALLAVSRWDVNWSRIGMHGVTVPFFSLWAMAALLRGLRTNRLAAFGWAGLALGIGLCFYSPLRIFPVIVAGYLLAWGARWLIQLQRAHPGWTATRLLRQTWSAWGVPALLFALGTTLAIAPVADFAQREPELFWDRARKVSIMASPEAQANPTRAVLSSTVKHLLMFHYRGDPNGRHNLPSAPMLARLTGVLMVFGLVLCLLRPWEPTSVLLMLWLFVPLSGGIMSTWFEAPQSLRSIGSLPAVYLLACLPMAWFAGEWARVFPHPGVQRRLALLALLVVGAIAVENGVTYFQVWGHDFASWAAFNPAETHLAQDINRYRQDYELRFDPLLTAHLATRYLAPDYEVYHHFDPATVFPLRGTSQQGIVLFIAPDTYPVRDLARELYPGVMVETFGHAGSDRIVLHKYLFTREELASVQGLDARYALPGDPNRVEYRMERALDVEWGDDPPLPRPFAASWTGGLLAPRYGAYRLQVELPGSFTLWVDGQPLLFGEGFAGRDVVLAQGTHSLALDGEVTDPGVVRLSWRPPGEEALRPVPGDALYRAYWPVRGLLGRYYANVNWEGEPELARIDRQIGYYFHFLPLPRPYTVEWTGRINVPVPGPYHFRVEAVSEATLLIDGELVYDSRSGPVTPGPLALSAGMHEIEVRFLDDRSHSQVYLYWEHPDGRSELVPSNALYPPEAGAWWAVP